MSSNSIPTWMSGVSGVINIIRAIPGLQMLAPKPTDEDVDPNQEPEKYIKEIKSIIPEKPANATVVFLVDVSGSNDSHYQVLIELVKLMPSNAIIVPFGQQALYGTQNQLTPAEYFKKYRNGRCFNCATYTTYIESVFTYLASITGPINLFFEGDGQFSDGNKIIQIIDNAGKTGVLDRIISLTLLFSSHTEKQVMDTLVSQITEICMRSANMIPINVNKLPHQRIVHPETDDIIRSALSTTAITTPAGYIRVGDLFIHRDMTAEALSRGLTPEMAHDMAEKFMRNAEINPDLLVSNPVYGRIYRALCMPRLFGKKMKLWMDSLLTKKDIRPDQKVALQSMLAQAKTDPNDVKANMRKLAPKIIGYLMFANIPGMKQSILDAMRTMDYAGLIRLVQNALKTARTELISADKRSPQASITAFPILNVEMATQEECMQALKSIFCQFGDFNLNGLSLYMCAIGIMTAETQVIPVVYRMVETALFDKLFTTLHFLGINMETNSWDADIRTNIMNPAVCGLLTRFFTQFSERLFPGVDFTQPSLATIAYYEVHEFARVYTICKFINIGVSTYRVIGSYEFKTTINRLNEFRVDMLVALKPFNKDPQPNLPSLAIIRSINGSLVTLEYLDRPLGTNDTVTINFSNVIPLYNLARPAPVNVNAIIEPFNVWLCNMQVQGARGELGQEMLMQADAKDRHPEYPVPSSQIVRNQDLYNTNMRSAITEFERLMTDLDKGGLAPPDLDKGGLAPPDLDKGGLAPPDLDNGFEPEMYKVGGFYPVDRPITRAELITILRAPGAFTGNMVTFLHTGNNPNSVNIDQCKGRQIGQQQTYPAGVSSHLVNDIVASFKTAMIPKPIGKLAAGTIWTCTCCLDTQNARDTVILGCTHALCKTCHEQMIIYNPAPGTIINEAMCRCPVCRVVLDDIRDNRLSAIIKSITTTGAEMPENPVIISCRVCRDYYIEHAGCGQDPATLPILCPAHRPREENIKVVECPHCHAGVIRTSGCDVVTCQCGSKFCFGCGVALPDYVGDWRCQGSQAECLENVDSNQEDDW